MKSRFGGSDRRADRSRQGFCQARPKCGGTCSAPCPRSAWRPIPGSIATYPHCHSLLQSTLDYRRWIYLRRNPYCYRARLNFPLIYPCCLCVVWMLYWRDILAVQHRYIFPSENQPGPVVIRDRYTETKAEPGRRADRNVPFQTSRHSNLIPYLPIDSVRYGAVGTSSVFIG